ncbi:MAG: hypothetical protein HQM16_14795 [Deltaproteobacteria bacterium]|nr:hypothetical protein [Deltaproteobacteria bacterium]
MNQIKNLDKLGNLAFFNKTALMQVCQLSEASLYANINRWIKTERLVQIKKGCYVTRTYLLQVKDQDAYAAFVANKIREPSYLSLESVLQKNSILTEAVFSHTNVTLKATRVYVNRLGTFIYHNIKESLFTGYSITKVGDFFIKEASPAKALFDYLYYKTLDTPLINEALVESLRLNLDELKNKDLKEFAVYCRLAGTKKLLLLPKIIRRLL